MSAERDDASMDQEGAASSKGTRFAASETNATTRPSPEMAGSRLAPSPSSPKELTDIRRVAAVVRSRTKMS